MVRVAEGGVDVSAAHAPEERRPHDERDRQFLILLVVIALVGIVARIAYVVWVRDRALPLDGLHYHFRALGLADGKGFVNVLVQQFYELSEPPADASNPPAWPLLLAGPSLVGVRSILSHQIVACVVGGGTIFMSGLAGRAAFSRRTGVLGALIVAMYPNVWLYERELMSEPLALFGAALCLFVAYRFHASPSPVLALALGASVGLLTMTRSEQIALLLFLVLPLVLSAQGMSMQRRIGCVAIAGIACVALIAPWTVHNTARFERPVILSTGLGSAMRAGNCDATYRGKFLGYYNETIIGYACMPADLPSEPSVADGYLRELALEHMNDNRTRVPLVAAARIGRTFSVFRPFQQVDFESNRHTPAWIVSLGMFSFWALAPLAVAGAVFARRRRIPIYPMLAFPAVVIVSVAITIGAVRYRAPAEIPLALLAAFAIDILTRDHLRFGTRSIEHERR
jgi:4-amino-4-deoxy-L-arabinose transferase-like glycosyltransferase